MEWWSHPSDPRWLGTLAASFSLSALITWSSIVYARRRGMFDQPGQRRSHAVATPRGGGIGIVIAALVFFCGLFLPAESIADKSFGWGVAIALVLVAAVGWLDDHRPLSARIRIFVHFVAAFALVAISFAGGIPALPPEYAHALKPGLMGFGVAVATVGLFSLIIVWSINLHNFMDGINGILACQAIFVFVVLGACTMSPGYQLSTWALAAATLGFLPFNFPRARVFMGDVGSGSLGLLIVVAAGLTLNTIRPPFAPALLAVSAFVVDATCTLLSRMLRGRRWYSAHCEHLYQWMTRSGMSHAQVVAWYMGWNLLVVAPVLHLANRGVSPSTGVFWAMAVYALAVAVWIFGKRWCLDKAKNATKQKV